MEMYMLLCFFHNDLYKRKYPGGHSDMQVYICMNNVFEIYPWTHFSHGAEITPKQGFCLRFDPLNRFESEEFEYKILTKTTLFFMKNGILHP